MNYHPPRLSIKELEHLISFLENIGVSREKLNYANHNDFICFLNEDTEMTIALDLGGAPVILKGDAHFPHWDISFKALGEEQLAQLIRAYRSIYKKDGETGGKQ